VGGGGGGGGGNPRVLYETLCKLIIHIFDIFMLLTILLQVGVVFTSAM